MASKPTSDQASAAFDTSMADDPPVDDIEAPPNEARPENGLDENASTASRASEAEAVRHQVEHYFSDENLQNDTFLLNKMKGRKNKPIPAEVIAGFSKMRQYQPLGFVVESMKLSNTVNVVKQNGIDCLQRKQPFIMPEHLKAPKTGRKSASKKTATTGSKTIWAAPSAATGFEEYFAEAPLAPDVAEEEERLYDTSDNSFEERIETAVHRYLARRKWTSIRRSYFTKWMRFGGVDPEPKTFTSNVSPEDLEGLTNKEKKQALAPKPYVAGEEVDEKGNLLWEVDFELVCKAFLSSEVPENINFEREEECVELINVMKNFLRYLLFHQVCPEHTPAINAALRICDRAAFELPTCDQLLRILPGPFNTAASTVHGGFFSGKYAGDQEWMQSPKNDGVVAKVGMPWKEAAYTYATGIVSLHEENLPSFDPTVQYLYQIDEEVDLEIVDILPPTRDPATAIQGTSIRAKPMGFLTCQTWNPPGFQKWDLPTECCSSEVNSGVPVKQYRFAMEEDILQLCEPGLKIEARAIFQLQPSGIHVLDGPPTDVRCSFYTIVENEISNHWKEPRWITRQDLKDKEDAWEQMRRAPEAGAGPSPMRDGGDEVDDEFD